MLFNVFKDKEHKDWRWNIRAANNRIIACSGEGFKTKLEGAAPSPLTPLEAK